MAWDDSKQLGDELTSSEWNDHVTDQKNHSTRHEYNGDDEINGPQRFEPQSEPATPTSGVVRWYDDTDDALKAKFDDGSTVTLAQK